jgi:DNA-binding transcriptional regulator YiaG
MTNVNSCSTPGLPCFPLDAAELLLNSAEHALRGSAAESDQTYVLRSDPKFAGYGGVINPAALPLPQCLLCWAKIIKAQIVAPDETERYRSSDINVKRKIASAMHVTDLPVRIRALRRSLEMNQKEFGAICGVGQVAVSDWENRKNPKVPSSRALFKMSEVAPASERQWWRDRAAEQAGVDIGIQNPTSGAFEVPSLVTKIPLIKDPQKVGKLGSVTGVDVERVLSFSPDLFPEGGKIEAVRILSHKADLIAVIDVSRQDAEHLIDKMVAVRTVFGIEVRWLTKEDGIPLLLPFQPGQTVKPMRYKGEWSIVGAVRWLGDVPFPDRPPDKKRVRQ